MIKGLYSAVSAMLAGVNRQKLLAHNAANVDTPGFKSVLTTLNDFMDTEVDFPPGGSNGPVRNVGTLGLGVETHPEYTNYQEAATKETGNLFDLAINGSGFFRIRTPQGERLTRDGRFLKDAQGNLVTVEGCNVLNANGQPIKLPEGEFAVSDNGTISVNDRVVDRLGIQSFKDPSTDLVRDENNKFVAVNKPVTNASFSVMQGALEMSNVNASELMTQMVTVARAYEAAQKMVTTQDELLGQTISSLGKFG